MIPLERTDDGRVRAGYYRPGTHRIVNMNHCPVLAPRIDELIEPLKAELASAGWPVDRDLERDGGLRHLGLRVGARTGEVLITLVSSHDRLRGLSERAAAWQKRWPAVVGVCLNLQPAPGNAVMGAKTRVISGRGWLEETFAGCPLRIRPDTFFQVHTEQAARAAALMQEALGAPDGLLVDAYCGIGTFALPLAKAGWRVHGIESNPAAAAQATDNARRAGLEGRASFEAGDASALLAAARGGSNALLLDPPRKGLTPAALDAILDRPPETLLYLSCAPDSLARDLERLVAEGPYALESAQPLDFFPNTPHVECLAVLRKRDGA